MSASTVTALAGRATTALRGSVLRRLPLKTLERMAPRRLVAFSYHLVADESLPYVKRIYNYKTTAEFEADVIYLKRHYRLPTWPEWIAEGVGAHADRRQAAMLTFDDGMSPCFHRARPILLKHQVPCVFFVSSGFVDNRQMFYRHKVALCLDRVETSPSDEQARLLRAVGQDRGIGEFSLRGFSAWLRRLEFVDDAVIDRVCTVLEVDIASELARLQPYLTSAQIAQMASEGFTIGGHTRQHARMQLLGDAAREREIVESCAFVRDLLGATDVPFAFPFGGGDLDRGALAAVVARHPWIRVLFDTGGLAVDAPFIIHRIAADEPAGEPIGRSGLDRVIRSAYADELSGRAGARRRSRT